MLETESRSAMPTVCRVGLRARPPRSDRPVRGTGGACCAPSPGALSMSGLLLRDRSGQCGPHTAHTYRQYCRLPNRTTVYCNGPLGARAVYMHPPQSERASSQSKDCILQAPILHMLGRDGSGGMRVICGCHAFSSASAQKGYKGPNFGHWRIGGIVISYLVVVFEPFPVCRLYEPFHRRFRGTGALCTTLGQLLSVKC